ncbi:MAG TPA: TetR/AcrR family transcriptional regulator [Acidimicrobiales bacterium]|nr:TetR/AcrR family transcriptional regulator [Acidimicrobiales bacterium]
MSPRPSVEAERREEILTAAWYEIVHRGYAGTRVADIAQRSGTSSATVHYYFPTRSEVLSEALRFAMKRARERHEQELAGVGTLREQLVRLVELQIPVGSVHDDFRIWLEVWNEASRRAELRPIQDDSYERWVNFVKAIVTKGQRRGEFATGVDAAEVVAQLLAIIDGLAIQVVAGSSHLGPDEMRKLVLSFLERELFRYGQ